MRGIVFFLFVFFPLLIFSQEAVSLKVSTKPSVYHPSPLGINLGAYAPSGTQQILKNVIPNPGFEKKIERAILIVSHANALSFSDEVGLGYEDNYWTGASFAIHTGIGTGPRGKIQRSLRSGEKGFPQYFSDRPLPEIPINSVVVLTRETSHALSFWQTPDQSLVSVERGSRPGGAGEQVVRLVATRTGFGEISVEIDRTAKTEGNAVLEHTPWQLKLWARSDNPLGELSLSLHRTGQNKALFEQIIHPSADWLEYTFDLHSEQQTSAPLRLSIKNLTPSASVWIDDVALESQQNSSSFRQEVVDLLKKFKPSYLREFPSLGDSFENRIAAPSQRKTVVYRSIGGNPKEVYNYSLTDFLNLCEEVNANPWIVIPPAFSDEECRGFGQFLAMNAQKGRFEEVIVEFGADNWNWLFRPMTIPYSDIYGMAATRAFTAISREAKSTVNLRCFVNGPYSTFRDALKYFNQTKNADGLAVNPYFFPTLEKAVPDQESLKKLLKKSNNLVYVLSSHLFSKGKYIAISEMNFNTLRGDAGSYERNRLVAGAASGAALAYQVIDKLYSGADPILINGLTGLHTQAEKFDGNVALWGIVRDFGPPAKLRPTGQALWMLNQVVGGNLYSLLPTKEGEIKGLASAAFKTPTGWTAALVSASEKPLHIEIAFPEDGHSLPQHILWIEASDPFQTNELTENVRIASKSIKAEGRIIRCEIPPWGFVVLSTNSSI